MIAGFGSTIAGFATNPAHDEAIDSIAGAKPAGMIVGFLAGGVDVREVLGASLRGQFTTSSIGEQPLYLPPFPSLALERRVDE